MENNTGVSPQGAFETSETFSHFQHVAMALSKSTLVPEIYRGEGNIPNVLIALNMANRLKVDPLMIMQNMHVIHGKPSFSSTYIISAINTCGRYKNGLKFKYIGNEKDDTFGCIAYATDNEGNVDEGPEVTIAIAKAEGWHAKAGSKWKTIPKLMLMYRAASFFGRLYAPESINGMLSDDEQVDSAAPAKLTAQALNEHIHALPPEAAKVEQDITPDQL